MLLHPERTENFLLFSAGIAEICGKENQNAKSHEQNDGKNQNRNHANILQLLRQHVIRAVIE